MLITAGIPIITSQEGSNPLYLILIMLNLVKSAATASNQIENDKWDMTLSYSMFVLEITLHAG